MTRSPAQAGLHRLVLTYVRSEERNAVHPARQQCRSFPTRLHLTVPSLRGVSLRRHSPYAGARMRSIRGSSRWAVMLSASEDALHALMRAPQYPRGTSTRVSTRFIPPGSNATLLPLGGTVTRALCARCRSSGSVVPRVMRPNRASTRRHGVGSNATLPV